MKTYKQAKKTEAERYELGRLMLTKLRPNQNWYRLGRWFTTSLLELTTQGIAWTGVLHECDTQDCNNNSDTLPEKQVIILERELVDQWKLSTASAESIVIDLRG